MTDAGFFRGTSSDQDNRFANKQKKLLKELNYSPILATKIQTSKIDLNSLKPWIENKIKEILEKDDEILSELINEHLAEKEPDGKTMLVSITGFVDDQTKANKFMEDLWNKLVDLQNDSNGVSNRAGADSNENEDRAKNSDNVTEIKKTAGDEADDNSKHSVKDDRTPRSSRTPTPPRRSVSKSPTGQKLDEHSRGRPRRRLQNDDSPMEDSQSHASKDRKDSNSRSRSRSHSRDGRSSRGHGSRSRSNSRSRSRSKASGSRSRSRSYSRSSSRSITRSRSKSSSRSPRRRSRSPHGRPYRGRRTRSRSRSREYRLRSRSPRARRGSYNNRGPYRGGAPFVYPDRRRGGFSSFRRRPSPSWGRRRFSPRSPIRRRRTPSYSPRRRRSPPSYGRRYSRSRSPPNIVMGRDAPPSPRGHHASRGHLDSMIPRHVHHDMHRPMPPMMRSPARPLLDQRGYNEGSLLPRRSPGPVMGRPDLPPPSQGFLPAPAPARSGSSSSSGRKKHKRDKKHRKHKKSKKHHSDSPDRKKKHKKHKKHKKSKKHKS